MSAQLKNKVFAKYQIDMKELAWLILIFIGAIGFRLILMTKTYAVGFDEVNYLKLAADAKLNGISHVMHPYWPPLFPLALAAFSYIVPNYELAGRLLSILCNVALIFPFYFLVKQHLGKRIAYLVALLVAFYTMYAKYSVKIETEALYIFLAILGIFIGWSTLNKRSVWKSLIVGILFGGAYLLRPEGIGFLLVFLGLTGVVIIINLFSKQKVGKYFLIILLSFAGFMVVAFPYLNYLKNVTGGWTISAKGISNQLGELYLRTKAPDEPHPFHVLRDNNTRLIEDEIYHLGNFTANLKHEKTMSKDVSIFGILKKIGLHNYQIMTKEFLQVFPLPIVIILVLGLLAVPWTRKDFIFEGYLLCFVLFFWFLLIPSFHISIRYFIPLMPLCFIWLVKGGDRLKAWIEATLSNVNTIGVPTKWIQLLATILVVGIVVFGAIIPEFAKQMKLSRLSTQEWDPAIEQKEAGLWLKAHGVKSPIVMAYNHAVSFYAGNYDIRESVEIPENKVADLIAYARYRGVNYLVLDDRYKAKHPLISDLYEEKDIPPDLKLIYTKRQPNGLATHIYEILKP
ncbi:glycosyltransferase family 39 protein [candidate division KSB1 bacterium]|nr:glycosyltransferase family 39 protein [candidate division KSB1 bacterium]